ncbi:MAG: hypothetical protein C4547_11620 [Phycisphaerales bacterium]|nr:MAG: hypothetical protein C4547_11620 [Phycisphaerales bacterium]
MEAFLMRQRKAKAAAAAAVLLGGGVMFLEGAGGCAELAGQATLGSVDFCFLFDCVDGAIGGLLRPCDDVGAVNPNFDDRDSFFGGPSLNFGRTFSDCP